MPSQMLSSLSCPILLPQDLTACHLEILYYSQVVWIWDIHIQGLVSAHWCYRNIGFVYTNDTS